MIDSISEWEAGRVEFKMDIENGRVYQKRMHVQTPEGERLVIDIDYTDHNHGAHVAPHYHIYRWKNGGWSKKGNGISSTGQPGLPAISGDTFNGPQPWKH